MNSIKLSYKIDTIFMNSEKKQNIVYYSILQLKNLKKSGKYVALSILSIHFTLKNKKSHTKKISLKYQLQRGIKKLNYLMDFILYQIICQDYCKYIMKKSETITNNSPMKICVNQMKNRITFRIKN